MDTLIRLIGSGKDLDSLQMAVRSVIIFFLALIMLKIAGIRTFGKKSAFDNVVIIMLGAILSRAIVGSSPFIPTVSASFVMVTIHWLLGALSYRSDKIGALVKGERTLLLKNKIHLFRNMRKVQISEKDIQEEIRLQLNEESMENIGEIWLERNGSISIIKKTEVIPLE